MNLTHLHSHLGTFQQSDQEKQIITCYNHVLMHFLEMCFPIFHHFPIRLFPFLRKDHPIDPCGFLVKIANESSLKLEHISSKQFSHGSICIF